MEQNNEFANNYQVTFDKLFSIQYNLFQDYQKTIAEDQFELLGSMYYKEFCVVHMGGLRQSGKTTWAKNKAAKSNGEIISLVTLSQYDMSKNVYRACDFVELLSGDELPDKIKQCKVIIVDDLRHPEFRKHIVTIHEELYRHKVRDIMIYQIH